VSGNRNVEYGRSLRDGYLTWGCVLGRVSDAVGEFSDYDDRVISWNPGRLPDDCTVDRLLSRHPSRPADATGVPITFPIGTRLALSRHQVDVLRKSRNESNLVDLMSLPGRGDRTRFRNQECGPPIGRGEP
jgi:hypothetical protein